MYHIVICDDEKEILQELSEKIKEQFERKNICAEYSCVDDSRTLMQLLQTEKVDVLFLDIDMPYFSGMDIAGWITENGLNTILVFVTSHDALVYQTFAYRPFGFMRKTHLNEEIEELIQRIEKALTEQKQELILSKGQELIRIFRKDIVYIESEGNYLNIYEKNQVIKIRETMTNMEKQLDGKNFIRCHKGYLINADYIQKWKTTEIEMTGEKEKTVIPIGRSYEKEVRKKILECIRP